jgi:PilZ domain
VADRQSSPPLSTLGRDVKASEVNEINQSKRSIVRKRTQQLVYLELGRDNGGVMLNLSEDGCGFQAITPVKCGETRFGFQISGGRRIAGEAEVMWVDDVGIMGGLRFLNLPLEARKQIRRWLEETKAPEEHGAFEPVAEAPLDTVARGFRGDAGREASAEAARSKDFRQTDYRQAAPVAAAARVAEEAPQPAPAWANLRASIPPVQDERFSMPLLREDGPFATPRPRSVAMWRGIAVMALATAVAALVVAYQREVGSSLIWLGETLSGKTKASAEMPEGKPTPANTTPDGNAVNTSPAVDNSAAPQKPEERKTDQTNATSKATPETSPATAAPSGRQASRLDAVNTGGPQHQESVLERQQIPRSSSAESKPESWNASDSVESLWGAVQGGSVSAERSLAERFVHGEGVAKNCDQAKVLLKAAADRGSREARLRLYELETGSCQ